MLYLYTDISVILTHPEIINVTTNSEVEFSCVAIATEIIFFVNRGSLIATALTQYNNTEGFCIVLIVVSLTEINSIPSDVAILRVQG